MSPATFSEHFQTLADAPSTVAKLREMTLQMAVHGSLVPQDPRDEPADELLARIAAKIRDAAPSRQKRCPTKSEPAIPHEPPYDLPASWRWARFDQVATIASNLVQPHGFGDCPHVAPDNIEKGTGRLLPYRTVDEDGVRSGNHRFFAGQIVYSKIRPNLAKAAIVDFDGLCSADMYPIDAHVDAGYLLRYMLSNVFLGMAVRSDTRVAMPKINQEELSCILVAVPPLAEQRRIVTKVDELMELCDELEGRVQRQREARERLSAAALDRLLAARDPAEFARHWQRLCDHFDLLYDAPETLAQLRQAILQLAVQGKLVAQDPCDEPAEELLAHIDARRDALVKEGKLRAEPPTKNLVFPQNGLPNGWAWAGFGRVTFCRDGERVPVSKAEREGKAQIYDYYGASGVIDKVDAYLFDKPLLLIGEDGANLINRSTPIAFIAEGKYWVNNHAHVLDGIDRTLLEYLRVYINSINLESYITGMAQPKMNQAKMNSIPVPLPPLAEQRRIVAKVDHLMSLCDALEAKLKQAQTDSDRLLAAAVQRSLDNRANGEA